MNYVFICTGNICRSAMAEGIARSLNRSTFVSFSSMGTGALTGSPADENAQAVCAEIGVDISQHRARDLNIQELMQAEKIFCMDMGHCRYIKTIAPAIADKTMLLTDFPKKRLLKKEIWDPFRRPIQKFRKNRDMIHALLEEIVPLL